MPHLVINGEVIRESEAPPDSGTPTSPRPPAPARLDPNRLLPLAIGLAVGVPGAVLIAAVFPVGVPVSRLAQVSPDLATLAAVPWCITVALWYWRRRRARAEP